MRHVLLDGLEESGPGALVLLDRSLKLDDIFQLAADCVDKIANGDEVENAKAYKKGELLTFFEGMNNLQFQEVQKFFETMPKVSHTIEVFNPKTEKKSEMVLEGMASFFA